MELKNGTGTVMASTPQDSLTAGSHTVKILEAKGENDGLFVLDVDGKPVLDKDGKATPAVSENLNVKLEYPNGFVKYHQVKDKAVLADRITNQLRNHYGVMGDIVIDAPNSIVTGSTVKIQIKE